MHIRQHSLPTEPKSREEIRACVYNMIKLKNDTTNNELWVKVIVFELSVAKHTADGG